MPVDRALRIGVDEDFFAAGGTSLLVVRLVSRIKEVTGVRLTPSVVFDERTPARLAARIAEGQV